LKITHYKSKPHGEWIPYSSAAVQITPKPFGPGVFLIRKGIGRLAVAALKWDDGSQWDATSGTTRYGGEDDTSKGLE